MRIVIQRHELSDHSPVFDVVLDQGQGNARITVPAISERDAEQLRFELVEAFRYHSNETIREW